MLPSQVSRVSVKKSDPERLLHPITANAAMSPQDRVQVLSKSVKEQRQSPITAISTVFPEGYIRLSSSCAQKGEGIPAYFTDIYILEDPNVKKRPPILRQKIIQILVSKEYQTSLFVTRFASEV